MTKTTTGLAIAAAVLAAASGAYAQQRGVTATEVTFGMPTDLSGPAATYGVSSSNGVKMRFEEANEQGGINGRKLKVIVEDQAYQVPKAVQACNKLINRDKVFAFVAPLGTPMNNACFKDQFAAGVPLWLLAGGRWGVEWCGHVDARGLRGAYLTSCIQEAQSLRPTRS